MTGAEPAAPPSGAGGLVRVRLDLVYDGTDFAGWASQPGRRTVQHTVEGALAVALGLAAPPRLAVAGRTDAGVHARGQVAHADVPVPALAALADRARRRRPPGEDRGPGDPVAGVAVLAHRLAGLLPPDVAVRRVAAAPPGFDARFSALSRRYAYRLHDREGPVDPLRRRDVVGRDRPLDLDAVNAAAAALLGLHDFAAYCRHRPGASAVRTLLSCSAHRDRDGLAVFDVEADAFCHGMVRALVSALAAVGDGRRRVGWPAQVLAAGHRDPSVGVMPARGLVLEQVRYPADGPGVAEQAERARRVRALPAAGPAVPGPAPGT